MSAPKIPPEGVEMVARHMGEWTAIERREDSRLGMHGVFGILIPTDGGDWVRREEYEAARWAQRQADHDADRYEQEVERLEAENGRLRELLRVAKCPECTGGGAVPYGDPDNPDWYQCRWCYERDAARDGV